MVGIVFSKQRWMLSGSFGGFGTDQGLCTTGLLHVLLTEYSILRVQDTSV